MKRFLLAVILVSQGLAENAFPRLYWTDKDLGLIEASDSDGGNRVLILENLSDPRGIAVDPVQEKMFWASHETNGAIWWADCDGANAEVFISSLNDPADLVLDLEERLIYWAAESSGLILCAELDGDRHVSLVMDGLVRPYYLALDDDWVYWSYFNSPVIERASKVDGSGRAIVVSGQSRVRDIEVADGMIYWCDRNSSQLRRRALNGAGGGEVLFSGSALDRPRVLDRPHGLVLDSESGTMYWTDTATTLVGSSAMDGSGTTTTLASIGLDGPWAIALARPMPLTDPYEGWKSIHFSEQDLQDPLQEDEVWGIDADPDLDGRSNLLEFAQGTDPRSAVQRQNVFRVEAAPGVRLLARIRADDSSLNYSIEGSSDLSSGSWNEDLFLETGETIPDTQNPAY